MTELQDLKKRIDAANSAHARASVELEQATANHEDVVVALKEEFNVTTPNEIKIKLEELKSQRQIAFDKVIKALDEAGA